MVSVSTLYEGQLRCRAEHGPSQATLVTDAPLDNHGKGESFSPTDLVAVAFGACMMTIMGIAAQRHGIDRLAANAADDSFASGSPPAFAAGAGSPCMPRAKEPVARDRCGD